MTPCDAYLIKGSDDFVGPVVNGGAEVGEADLDALSTHSTSFFKGGGFINRLVGIHVSIGGPD